jgi:hypothetical protein
MISFCDIVIPSDAGNLLFADNFEYLAARLPSHDS